MKPSQEPTAAPAGLQALYRAFERIAPAFIEAKGLPKPGSDAEALKLEAALPSDPAYQTPRLLASILLPWAAGDTAKAKANALTAKSSPSSNLLTQRWADRVLASK